MRRAAAVALAVSCLTATPFARQQPRDVPRSAQPAGTATIAGTVTSDDAQAKPLRRVQVTVRAPELGPPRTAITNDDGTFVLGALPAGRYTITASKPGYVTVFVGARRPGQPGIPVAIRDGESRTVAIRIPRGAVITGTVTDPDGRPAVGIGVRALTSRYVGVEGTRRAAPANVAESMTDDRGIYRIFGLPAGDYRVAAQVGAADTITDRQMLSPGEAARALAEIRQDTQGRSATASRPDPTIEPRKNLAAVPTFFPGTAVPAQARTISVSTGEERAGIDFQLEYVPAATISGRIATQFSSGRFHLVLLPVNEATPIETVRTTSIADDRFWFRSIPPGRYSLLTSVAPVATNSGSPPNPWYASTEIVVEGQDITDVVLSPQPALTMRGRIAFEGTTPLPPLPLSMRIGLPIAVRWTFNLPPPVVRIESDWRFEIHGIMPGELRATNASGVRTPLGRWWLKSILLNGVDLLDAPVTFRESVDGAVVTFSDKASELAGTVSTTAGEHASNYIVVVFSADRRSWFFNSRRVAGERVDAQGSYKISNLPAGDYLLAASDDLEFGEWFDPAVLLKLAPLATKLRIADNERKTYDMTVPAR